MDHGTTTPLQTTRRLELRLTSEHLPQSHETEVTPGVRCEYELRLSPDKWQAWVVSKETGRVVLSVDFKTHEAWTDPAQQPDWATKE